MPYLSLESVVRTTFDLICRIILYPEISIQDQQSAEVQAWRFESGRQGLCAMLRRVAGYGLPSRQFEKPSLFSAIGTRFGPQAQTLIS